MAVKLIFRTIRLSLSNFLANKSRNLLSIITVTLGALAISAVFTVNKNVNYYVDDLMANSGGPNLFIYSKSRSYSFSQNDLKKVFALPSSRYLAIDNEVDVNMVYRGKTVGLRLFQYGNDYLKARPSTLLHGQFLSQFDYILPSKNIVLSPTSIENLGIVSPVGKEVILNYNNRNVYAKVIGAAQADFDPNDRGIGWASKTLYEDITRSSETTSFIVGTTSYENLDNHEGRVMASLSKKFQDNIASYNPKQYFQRLRQQYQTFINAGAAVGFLALIGGSVGVMNLMLMSIRLRIKEIGLYRSLGFSTGVVLLIFLFESMITLSLGGLIGSGLGSATGYIIAGQIVKTAPFLSMTAFSYALGTSIALGLFFSYIPAVKASKMDTVEALRS